MKREDVIKRVEEYIKDDQAKYAFLISGNWGCGKTYLYEHFIVDAIDVIEGGKSNRKNNIYISLYGISSLKELSKELLIKFIAKKTTGGTKLIKKIDGVLSVISKSVSFGIAGIDVELEDFYDEIAENIEVSSKVICLDDLERSSIPINDLFGWIDNLIEHCDCKVIILADENRIGKMFANQNIESKYLTILTGGRKVIEEDKNDEEGISLEELKRINEKLYSENYIYKEIKEKVIGETVYYTPGIKETIADLIVCKSELPQTEYQAFLRDKSELIADQFRMVNHGGVNYRVVKLWIKMYKRIFYEGYGNQNDSEFVEFLAEGFIKYSTAKICEKLLNNKLVYSTNSMYKLCSYERYGDRFLAYPFLDKWFELSIWDLNLFFSAIDSAKSYYDVLKKQEAQKKKSTGVSLGKLSTWRYCSDDQVKGYIEELMEEVKEGKYVFWDYPTILNDLLYFKNLGLFNGCISDAVTSMKESIKNAEFIGEENVFPVEFEKESDQEEFEKYYSILREAAQKQNVNNKRKNLVNQGAIKNVAQLSEFCSENYDLFYMNQQFIGIIGIDELFNLIENSELEDRYEIVDIIRRVYRSSNCKEYLQGDLDQIRVLRDRIENGNCFGEGITEKYCRNYYLEELDKIIDKLG